MKGKKKHLQSENRSLGGHNCFEINNNKAE